MRMDDWVVPDIDMALCTRCGLCVECCPTHAVVMSSVGPSFADVRACTYCGACETICPEAAIALPYVIVWDAADPE
jgi:formate hydrogenlyase subunit 6/NADH:ubiquinone oxidoreductase subunit I